MTKIKVVKKMTRYPFLETKITISYANDVTSNKGVPYVAVGFNYDSSNGRTYSSNQWFPSDYADFAKSHIGKEVTAQFRFFSSRDRTTLSGVALME